MKIPQELLDFHRAYDGSVRWRLTSDGVEIEGSGIERTTGEPKTITRIWEEYNEPINKWAQEYNVPVELIVTTIATESSGRADSVREEPKYISDEETPHQVSPGIMQTLISTARGTLKKRGVSESTITRAWLLDAENSIQAGTSYIADQQSKTSFDPILVAAAYNAGSVYEQTGEENRFKVRQYPIGTSKHCDRFVKWFNDCWFVLKNHEIKATVTFTDDTEASPGVHSLPVTFSGSRTVDSGTVQKLYTHTEQEFLGGYFPVGLNGGWHGGIHILADEGQPVYAAADGVVVCARMPVEDSELTLLEYGSRNFVLIRHGEEGNYWYSLYYHLKSIPMDSDEASKIAWLSSSVLEFKQETGFHKTASGEVIDSLAAGDTVEIVGKDEEGWYEVVRQADEMHGFVKYDSQTMEEKNETRQQLCDEFTKSSGVQEVGIRVKNGDIIGYVGEGIAYQGGKPVKKTLVHWSILSTDQPGSEWKTAEDTEELLQCDLASIASVINDGASEGTTIFDTDAPARNDVIDFYQDESKAEKLRSFACKFKSEWAIDWQAAEEKIVAAGLKPEIEKLAKYNMWEEIVQFDERLPANGIVWHYNPVAYISGNLIPTAAPEGTLVLHYQLGVGEQNPKNDVITLETEDGSWSQSVAVARLEEFKPNWVEIVFEDVPDAENFNLKQDPGDEMDEFFIWKKISREEMFKVENG